MNVATILNPILIQSSTGNILQVTSTGSLNLPSGASTSSNQDTTNSKIDTINSSTGLLVSRLTTIDTDIKAAQPRKLQDGSGNAITSSAAGSTRPLDISIRDASGTLKDPTQIRVLTTADNVTATISGTPNVKITSTGIIPVSQSGIWNITNITGTISLPTGAATSTGQATINTTIGNSQGSVSPGTAATKSTLIGGQYNSTLPTLTTGQQVAIQLDSNGRIILSSTGSTTVNQGSPNTNTNGWPVKITNGTTVVGVSTNSELRSSDTVNNGGVNGAITVGTSAVEAKVGALKLTNRKLLTIFHNGSGNLYWGYSNAVTTANGTQIFKNTMLALPVGDGTSVWLISSSAGQDVRITEGA